MATIALTSCVNDWLDLTPSDSIPSNSAITNYNDAKTALYGMYDGLQGNSTYTPVSYTHLDVYKRQHQELLWIYLPYLFW